MCNRCRGRLIRDLHDERTCLQCGSVEYPTPPLPYVRQLDSISDTARQARAREDREEVMLSGNR